MKTFTALSLIAVALVGTAQVGHARPAYTTAVLEDRAELLTAAPTPPMATSTDEAEDTNVEDIMSIPAETTSDDFDWSQAFGPDDTTTVSSTAGSYATDESEPWPTESATDDGAESAAYYYDTTSTDMPTGTDSSWDGQGGEGPCETALPYDPAYTDDSEPSSTWTSDYTDDSAEPLPSSTESAYPTDAESDAAYPTTTPDDQTTEESGSGGNVAPQMPEPGRTNDELQDDATLMQYWQAAGCTTDFPTNEGPSGWWRNHPVEVIEADMQLWYEYAMEGEAMYRTACLGAPTNTDAQLMQWWQEAGCTSDFPTWEKPDGFWRTGSEDVVRADMQAWHENAVNGDPMYAAACKPQGLM